MARSRPPSTAARPIRPLLCVRCGFKMDCTHGGKQKRAPEEGDIGVCANCGAVYVLAATWAPITPQGWADLPEDVRDLVLGMQTRTMQRLNVEPEENCGNA